jgi:hydroxymethylpyrimidine pyrophosphatase-like HAD family hydrolase
MIKLITIDLDGTLLDKDKNITEANLEAIKKCTEKGVYVVRARGRP